MSYPVLTYGGPIFSSFVTPESRINTFLKLKSKFWTKERSENYSRSGFFYLDEKVLCFYCGAHLKRIEEFVNPYIFHRAISKDCTFIKLNYPPQVRNIKQKCSGFILKFYFNILSYLQEKLNADASSTHVLRDVSCKICLMDLAQYVYLPCGHLLTCLECCTTQHICPLCRQDIKSIIKVFV